MGRDIIKPNAYVGLRLPSDAIQVVRAVPNTSTSIGKYGTFHANHIIGRPYHLTFEILDRSSSSAKSGLRVVPATELYANLNEDEFSSPAEISEPNAGERGTGVEYEVIGEDGEVVLRTNRAIIDDSNSQTMTMAEIEALKAEGAGSGKELVQRILDSHIALDQKTAFALAKYTLRKTKKYLRRFTVLPLDVSLLAYWMLTDKDPMKIMELREETLALLGSLSNVHCTPVDADPGESEARNGSGRWLMIDETGGLLVASAAEKMGLLDLPDTTDAHSADDDDHPLLHEHTGGLEINENGMDSSSKPSRKHKTATAAHSNTITVLHANSQPNLALLRYFNFDQADPISSHPLSQHLKTLSWLQLLAPEDDLAYTEPDPFPQEVIQTWKSGRRGNYYRKRRRWEKTKTVVDETRAGGFDGLMIATVMDLTTVLQHTVPLLRGGAQVVIYSPTIEPLVEIADYYSSARRTAFVQDPPDPGSMPTDDFPLDPSLLLATTIHTVRCRPWQVLPGRTHPLMTGRGGSEGYIFSATRVLPAEGKIEARGKGKSKRRKIDDRTSSRASEMPEQGLETPNSAIDGQSNETAS